MTKNTAVNYGILAGVGVVAYFLLFYFINQRLMLSPAVNWGSVAIFILFMVAACRREGELRETFSFKEALRTAFLVYVIAALIYYVFYYVMFGLIDTELLVLEREANIEFSQKLAQLLNLGDISQEIETFRQEDLRISFFALTLGFARSIIGGFIISLIIATLTKR